MNHVNQSSRAREPDRYPLLAKGRDPGAGPPHLGPPASEGRRALLERLSLLSASPEPAFDRICELAVRLMGVRHAAVGFPSDDRILLKGGCNLPEPIDERRSLPLENSLAARVIEHDGPVLIENSGEGSVGRRHPLLRRLGAPVAVLAVPIRASNGDVVGVCVCVRSEPHPWSDAEVESIEHIAQLAMREIEARHAALAATEQARLQHTCREETEALLRSTAEGIVGLDGEGVCSFINPVAAELLRGSPEELTGQDVHDLLHARQAGGADDCPVCEVQRTGQPTERRAWGFVGDDGRDLTLACSASPVRDPGDADDITGTVLAFRDRSTEERLERRREADEIRLRRQNRELARISRHQAIHQGDFEAAARVIMAAAGRALGCDRVEVCRWRSDEQALECIARLDGEAHAPAEPSILHESDCRRLYEALRTERVLATSDPAADPRTHEPLSCLLEGEGTEAFICAPITSGEVGRGTVVGMVCVASREPGRTWEPDERALVASLADLAQVAIEVEERRRVERALAERERLYRLLADSASDVVGLHDPDGTFRYVSPSVTRLLGHDPEVVRGRSVTDLVVEEDREKVRAALGYARSGERETVTFRLRRRDGSRVWVETVAEGITDEASGEVTHLRTTTRDVTERVAYEEELSHQAFHDQLTGLANRALFLDRLEHATGLARREGTRVGIVFIDLDRLKRINDAYEHAAGDEILRQVAGRLEREMRGMDTIARFGGDEFTVLLEKVESTSAVVRVAEKIEDALTRDFHIGGDSVRLQASIGVAFGPEPGRPTGDVLRTAELAMYEARRRGGAQYHVARGTVPVTSQRQVRLEADLRHAIRDDQLELHYQPLVRPADGTIHGAEALVRWAHPEEGYLSPDEFIPMAEETGLIVDLGEWVIERALSDIRAWPLDGDPFVLSLNVSNAQLAGGRATDRLLRALRASRPEGVQLEAEITESMMMHASGQVARLRDAGIRLAIDDFGTGCSSIASLRTVRPDTLKIDRMYVEGLGKEGEQEAIVKSVLALSRTLDLSVTAEGVETREQLDRVRRMGFDVAQGYFFSRPVPTGRFGGLLGGVPDWS